MLSVQQFGGQDGRERWTREGKGKEGDRFFFSAPSFKSISFTDMWCACVPSVLFPSILRDATRLVFFLAKRSVSVSPRSRILLCVIDRLVRMRTLRVVTCVLCCPALTATYGPHPRLGGKIYSILGQLFLKIDEYVDDDLARTFLPET